QLPGPRSLAGNGVAPESGVAVSQSLQAIADSLPEESRGDAWESPLDRLGIAADQPRPSSNGKPPNLGGPAKINGEYLSHDSNRCSRRDPSACCPNCWELWHSPPRPQSQVRTNARVDNLHRSKPGANGQKPILLGAPAT